MKIKKIIVEYTDPKANLRTDTLMCTRKIGHQYIEKATKTKICKHYKVDMTRNFFMSVHCTGGFKYNFHNSRTK